MVIIFKYLDSQWMQNKPYLRTNLFTQTPPNEQDAIQVQLFKLGFIGLNSEFPFTKKNWHTKVKKTSQAKYLLHAGEEIVRFITFDRVYIYIYIYIYIFYYSDDVKKQMIQFIYIKARRLTD